MTDRSTFEALFQDLERLLEQGSAHLLEIHRFEAPPALAADTFARARVVETLRELDEALTSLDFERPGDTFLAGFDRACRSHDYVARASAPLGTLAERGAKQLRQLSLDLSFDMSRIEQAAQSMGPLLQRLGEFIANPATLQRGGPANADPRQLLTYATRQAQYARMLQDIATAGQALRTTFAALADAQKTFFHSHVEIEQVWPQWQRLVPHYAQVIAEKPANARFHPEAPQLTQRLMGAVRRSMESAVTVVTLSERAKDELAALKRRASVAA